MTKNNSIIFIDWDDTLFPTSWVNKNNIDLKNIDDYSIFIKLDQYINSLLKKIMNKCEIIIVTNALKRWILSCLNLLPQTKLLICSHNFKSNNSCKNKINVISARENYQHKYTSPIDWKIHTFKNIINKYKKKKYNFNNIISIGDSIAEYIALIKLYNVKENCTFKTIKFIDPSIYEHKQSYKFIFDQIKVIFNNFSSIECNHNNRDMIFTLNN